MPAARLRVAIAERADAGRATLAVLGSRSACSWAVLAIYAPLGIAIQSPGNAAAFGGSPARWAVASAIGMCALGAVLGAMRIACRSGRPRPSAVLAVYAIGGVAQSVTFGLAAVAIGADDELHLAFRVSGILFHVPLLAVIGYAVGRHDAHRRVIADLERARGRLVAIGQSLEAELDRLEAELAGAVRASLEPALAGLDRALEQAAGASERANAVAALDVLIEQRIRPLSHDLAAGTTQVDRFADEAQALPARVPVPARFRLADGISPGVVAAALVIALLPTALRDLTPVQVLVYEAAFVGAMWFALTLARRAVRDAVVRTPVGVVALVAIPVALGSAVFQAIGAVGTARPTGMTATVAAFFALIGAVTVSTMLVQARRAASEAELAAVTAHLDRALALLRRRQRLVTRRLAFLVHGSLQGALHAAALRIAEATTVDEALITAIRRDVDAALAQIDQAPRERSERTATMLGEVTGVWGELRKVSTRIDATVAPALHADADADEAVAEVVREAINNAFRHGGADHIDIAATVADDVSAIVVTVRDDGGGAMAGRRGLGSALFDDLCRTWSVTRSTRDTTFHAEIPLRPMAVGKSGG
ncbi:MAG: hypothetical protein ACR2JV_09650 [Gaiellales bacterium]